MIRRRTLPFRILLLATVVTIVGYAAFRLVVSWRVGREVQRWQALGAPVVFADLCAVDGTSVENDPDNGAALLRESIATMTQGDFVGASTGFITRLGTDPVAGPANPQALADARALLLERQEDVARVMRGLAKPRLEFDFNWRAAIMGAADSGHLLGLMHWSRMLRGRIHVAIAEGRDADAIADLELALIMADSLAKEPTLEAYVTRSAILRSVAMCAMRLANRIELTPATSRRLADAFAQRLATTDLSTALHGERCVGTARILVPIGRGQALRDAPDQLNPLLTLPGFGDLMDLKLLDYYALMHEYEAAAVAFGRNRLYLTSKLEPDDFGLPSLAVIHREQAELVAALELTHHGFLLNAALAEGREPPTLASVLAGFDGSLIDPCGRGEETYGFLRNEHEYRIYSIGRNGIDEGGVERYHIKGLHEFRGGDIAFIRRLSAADRAVAVEPLP